MLSHALHVLPAPVGGTHVTCHSSRSYACRVKWTIDGLKAVGFVGFVRFADLPQAGVPRTAGVYVVVRPSGTPPTFLDQSIAGRFKGKDPTVALEKLSSKWLPRSQVVYIGKADVGASSDRSLRKRLDEYQRHGAGEPVGHWGGRYLWQLSDSADLLVCWKEVPTSQAESVESELIAEFIEQFGALPFANLKRGRSESVA